MSEFLFNHPHRDNFNGNIVVPLRIDEGHSGLSVIYRISGEESECIMTLSTWERYCRPVLFNSPEGP
jgi:hypothetical protein